MYSPRRVLRVRRAIPSSSMLRRRCAWPRRARSSRAHADDGVLIVGATRAVGRRTGARRHARRGALVGVARMSFAELAMRLALPVLAERLVAPGGGLGAEAIATRAAFDAHQARRAAVLRAGGRPAGIRARRRAHASASCSWPVWMPPRYAMCRTSATTWRRCSAVRRPRPRRRARSAGPRCWPPPRRGCTPIPTHCRRGPCCCSTWRSPRPPNGACWRRWRAWRRRCWRRHRRATSPRARRWWRRAATTRHRRSKTSPGRRRCSGCASGCSPPPRRRKARSTTPCSCSRRRAKDGRRSRLSAASSQEAARGVPFDEMAVLLRAPQTYLGLLEHAFARAGVPAWFERGTRRPDPAGRAFLALLACAAEGLSARRFAEYLSLAQVPTSCQWGLVSAMAPGSRATRAAVSCHRLHDGARHVAASMPAPRMPRRSTRRRCRPSAMRTIAWSPAHCARRGAGRSCSSRPMSSKASIAGSAACRDSPPNTTGGCASSPTRTRTRRGCARWPATATSCGTSSRSRCRSSTTLATWREARTLGRVARRLRCAGAARPPSAGPGAARAGRDGAARPASGRCRLREVRDVLAARLLSTTHEPPRRRAGRVLVGTPQAARGRRFRVVFVPGLAERVFPQRLREDALLLDARRAELAAPLPVVETRADDERLQLRLAVGAATDRALPVVSAPGTGRVAAARAVVLRPRRDARHHRRDPALPGAERSGVRERPRVAGLAGSADAGRRDRRLRTRPRHAVAAAAAAGDRAGRGQRPRPLPARAESGVAPVDGRTLGALAAEAGRRPTGSPACSR